VNSPSQRPLPKQQTQQTTIHVPSGILTHDLSNHAALDLRLSPHGHSDRTAYICTSW